MIINRTNLIQSERLAKELGSFTYQFKQKCLLLCIKHVTSSILFIDDTLKMSFGRLSRMDTEIKTDFLLIPCILLLVAHHVEITE